MIKKIIITMLMSLVITNVQASVLGDCADAGNSVCSDDTNTSTRYDPTVSERNQCVDACNSQAGSISNSMNANHANGGKWVCTATSSNPNGLVSDTHGNTTLLCECSITCVKGIVKTQILIDPIEI
ncbi:MAG: hypothetical protein JKY19_06695 [Alcanivoracaceae bacterium]|nr:hypothetical protein [Alcanivoracaceae bacterium]